MIDFDTFTKIALECKRFGQINCCQRLFKKLPKGQKIAQSGHTDSILVECGSIIDANAFEIPTFGLKTIIKDS